MKGLRIGTKWFSLERAHDLAFKKLFFGIEG